jgi:hypothetical protein
MSYSEGGIEMDELGFWINLALWIAAGIGFWRAYLEITTIRAQTGRAAGPK